MGADPEVSDVGKIAGAVIEVYEIALNRLQKAKLAVSTVLLPVGVKASVSSA
ncbi:MAG TPA: hypothetical protein VGH86_00500 [Phenylobacterium sp.]|jgi:hypothetical protein